MTATSDLIIERRRMRRRLAFWRILAILAVVAVFVIAAVRLSAVDRPVGDHVARIWITGVITDDFDRDEELRAIAEDDDAKALIVRINSPGGTVAGSEALFASLRDVAAKKPVVAVMSEAAASGGYIAAIAADHIVARENTLTGSIGVVAEAPNFAGLLEMLGVDVMRVKSAPLKAEPAILTEPAPGSIEAQQRLIDESFRWFRQLVGERRGLEGDRLAEVSDGRAFTGGEAVALGLIDTIGGEQTAVDWLETAHGIEPETKIRTREWGRDPLPFPLSLLTDDGAMGLSAPSLSAVAGPRLYAVMQ